MDHSFNIAPPLGPPVDTNQELMSQASAVDASPTTSRHTPSHAPSSSSDFGTFSSAPPPPRRSQALSAPSSNQPSLLDDDDLLGSFEDSSRSHKHYPAWHDKHTPVDHSHQDVDLLGGDTWHDVTARVPRDSSWFPPATASPKASVHIPLPPRPTDISPDYVHPLRSPRRMSTTLFSPGGLSSPPILSDAGNEIIFHPSQSGGYKDDAMAEMRRVQHAGPSTWDSTAPAPVDGSPTLRRSISRSPPRPSKLLDTLATTTKLASKWRSALTTSTLTPPGDRPSSTQVVNQLHNKPSEAMPIDVTHVTPFATAEQIAGSYTAPSGAPGFHTSQRSAAVRDDVDSEWGQVTLLGRRDNTTPVLAASDAKSLRSRLPPRQRLSSVWTLLFSLDQHGASLSTLYRLVDRYRESHPTSGNVLVVRDGEGNRFGVYMNESIVKREGTYYGSGESFLFKLSAMSDVKSFRWTGRNQYFALCESSFVSFGGGAGAYGLLLDSNFTHNSSATCPAYDNEVLCQASPSRSARGASFECVGLEVWAT